MLKNTQQGYGVISIALHWLSAISVIGLFGLGFWMVELTYYSSWYKAAPDLHKNIGVLLLVTTLCRMLWSWVNPKPKALTGHKSWEQALSQLVHQLLYIMLLGIFVSGYLISTADGRGIAIFNTLELPSLGLLFEGQADLAGAIHKYLAYSLMAIVVIHGAGAIKHHFIDKDSTLMRMLKVKEIK